MLKEYFEILKRKAKIIIICGGLLVLHSLFFSKIFKGHHSCLFKELTGFPCPGCGLTRAYKALFRGQFLKSFYYHPLYLVVPFVFFIIIFTERPIIKKIYKSKLFWLFIALLFLITYIIRMILVFPREPLEASEGLIFKIFRNFYKK